MTSPTPGVASAVGAALWQVGPFGAVVWDVSGREPGAEVLVGVNAEAAVQSGADFSGDQGRMMRDVFPAMVGTPIHDAIRAAAGGDSSVGTVAYGDARLPSGHFDVHYLPMVGGLALVLYVNVTERVEAARSLQSSINAHEEFTSAVSHDLQTPLRSIDRWLLRALDSAAQAEKANGNGSVAKLVEQLKHAQGSATRLQRMLAGVREVSRVSRRGAAMRDAELAAVVRSGVLDLISEGHDIDIDTGSLRDVVRCCPDQIARAVLNLAANGIKYQNQGAIPRVAIRGESRPGVAVVVVEDNGIGIEPRHHGRIFRIFERLLSVDAPGEGAGLALVAEIMRRHGGSATVQSDGKGRGSAFRLEWPI